MPKWVGPVGVTSGAIVLGAIVLFAGSEALRPQGQEQAAVQAFEAPVDVDTSRLPGPRQPIFYRHDIHAGQYEIDCRYCHSYAEISTSPGLPTVASCMGCHLIIGTGNAEVQKLRDANASGEPIEWIEVHHVPPFVHFPHNLHVVKGELACQECHGEIERMPQVYQFASLKMGWCISCHQRSTYADNLERQVSTDCTACHY